MFSFFKRKPSPDRVQAELGTIAMTMARFESYGFRSIAEISHLLNTDFSMDVPSTERQVEGRIFMFNKHADLGLSISCDDPFNPGNVTGYILLGYNDIANCVVQGNTGDQGESFTWSIAIESRHREVPPLTKALQDAFWKLPGYQILALGEHRFLSRRLT